MNWCHIRYTTVPNETVLFLRSHPARFIIWSQSEEEQKYKNGKIHNKYKNKEKKKARKGWSFYSSVGDSAQVTQLF